MTLPGNGVPCGGCGLDWIPAAAATYALRVTLGGLANHVNTQTWIEKTHEREALTLVDRITAPGILLHVFAARLRERGLVAGFRAASEDDIERVLGRGVERGPATLRGRVQRLVQAVADRILRNVACGLDRVRQSAHVLDRDFGMDLDVNIAELGPLEHNLERLSGRNPACFVGVDATSGETSNDRERSSADKEAGGLPHTSNLLVWLESACCSAGRLRIIDPIERNLFSNLGLVAFLTQSVN